MESNPDLVLLLMASGLFLSLLTGFLVIKYKKNKKSKVDGFDTSGASLKK